MLTTASPARRASSSRRTSTAGGDAVPGRDMPMASAIELMVLAVNIPPHAPSPGQALRSISTELLLGDLAERTGTNGFEDAGDVERHAVVLAGQDGAVVDEHAGQVEPGRGHQHRRDALVATRETDEAIEPLGVHDALDRVGDDLATDQRGAHALVTHADPVADGDGAELHREPAGCAHAGLGVLGQLAQCHVARGDVVPCVRRSRSAASPSRRRSCRQPATSPAPAPSVIPSVTSRLRGLMSTCVPCSFSAMRRSYPTPTCQT